MRAILLVRLDGMGDCVMTLPALAQLKQCFPAARLTVVTRESTAPVFLQAPSVDEVLPLPAWESARRFTALMSATRFFWRWLRPRRFDMAIHPRWDSDLSLASYLCSLTRAPVVAGYADATTADRMHWNGGFDRGYNVRLPAGPLQHEVERNLDLVRALGCEVDDSRPRLVTTTAQREVAQRWIEPCPEGALLVALGLPAAAPKRRWDVAHYSSLLEVLARTREVVPIVFADGETLTTAREIQRSFPGARIAAGLSLTEVFALLEACDVFVGSDSGLAHVASAVGCRTVTISPHPRGADPGHPNSPDRFRPFGGRSVVVQPVTGRPGCEAGCDRPEAHCILDVTVDAVAQAAQELLAADAKFAGP